MKKTVIVLLGAVLLASCNKTYTCTDAYGNTLGEVKASSAGKAASRCPQGSTAKQK